MHVVFVEPCFPSNQREFLRGLLSTGARISAISERPIEALPRELREGLFQFERVRSIVDEHAMAEAVKRLSQKVHVDRLEATVEAHVMAAAHVREQLEIPGTSSKTAWLCRDKPAMKDAVRAAGIACAASARVTAVADAENFAKETGYPLILKPLDGAGASGTYKVENDDELAKAIAELKVDKGREVAIEEFLTGHEGFYDTLTVCGKVVLDFACHYYPNVLEAMRTRWISPQIVVTNRIDSEGYLEVRKIGQQVVDALGIWTSPTHMEWFAGDEGSRRGVKFSEIGCRPPGVGVWDLYCSANEFDLFAAWAHAIVHEDVPFQASRKYSAGMIALRPDRDGTIAYYEGVEEMQERCGDAILDMYLPPAGTATQGVEGGYMANAYVRLRHPDYDELREMMTWIGETVKVKAK